MLKGLFFLFLLWGTMAEEKKNEKEKEKERERLFSGKIQDLTIGGWEVKNSNQSVVVPGWVPGQVHLFLEDAEVIGDPYFRFNDVDERWVAMDHWDFNRSFKIEKAIYNSSQIHLVLTGVDTLATIYVNDHFIGETANIFQKYTFVLPHSILKESDDNDLLVKFKSSVVAAQEGGKATGDYYVPVCVPDVQNGFCQVQMLRKIQSDFSWDWGPGFAPTGIQNVQIIGVNGVQINYVTASTVHLKKEKKWEIQSNVYVTSSVHVNGTLSSILFSQEDEVITSEEQHFSFHPNVPYTLHMSYTVPDSLINSWMPVGYGDPNLYPLVTTFQNDNGIVAATHNSKIGFREVELVQDPLENGTSFYFKVNGQKIWAKGANWIPADAFSSRVDPNTYYQFLRSMVAANMNMIRVWGGGRYQDSGFYQFCDQLGLLVWQETMFACATYRTDSEFLSSVKEEVKHQVLRLQHHPSICLWSTNNENEAMLAENWYDIPSEEMPAYYDQYSTLYFDTVLATIELYDTSRPMIASSPSNGNETKENPISENPQYEFMGDVHYYNYDDDCWDESIFPRPRFASEYGYQSFPSFLTLRDVSIESDWFWDSPFMMHRQHHEDGNDQIMAQLKRHYLLPDHQSDSVLNFSDTLLMVQISHAQCIKNEAEHYRRLTSNCSATESGCTMGSLYWQANDIWQAASWSSIEYTGRWKVLHYYARNFYSQGLVSLSSYKRERDVYGDIYLVNDHSFALSGSLTICMWAWMDNVSRLCETVDVTQSAESASVVYTVSLTEMEKDANCHHGECVLVYDFAGNRSVYSRNWFFLTSLKNSKFSNPQLKIGNIEKRDGEYEGDYIFDISFSGDYVAPYVWFETKFGGYFSDNAFLFTPPNVPSVVSFYTRESVLTPELLKEDLTLRSLYEIVSST